MESDRLAATVEYELTLIVVEVGHVDEGARGAAVDWG